MITTVAEELCSSVFQWRIKTPTEKLNVTLPNARQGDIGDLVIFQVIAGQFSLIYLLYNSLIAYEDIDFIIIRGRS